MIPEAERGALPLGQSACCKAGVFTRVDICAFPGMNYNDRGPFWLPMGRWPSLPPFQSIQPTANLDRTDDSVYHNVMTLVEAVLDLKNRLSQLPPEDYVLVVKVTDRVGAGQGGRAAHPGSRRKTPMPHPLASPTDPRGTREPLGSPVPGSLRGQMPKCSPGVWGRSFFKGQVNKLPCSCSLRMWD